MTLLLLVCLLSGAAGLIYQITWIYLFKTIFGAELTSITIVVSTFFLGLALGSRYWGTRADRANNQLKLYAGIEAGIAVLAVLVPVFLRIFSGIVERADLYHLPIWGIIKVLAAVAIMLPPTFLMGGTLPVLGRYIGGVLRQRGAPAGLVYGYNTTGAVLGAAIASFVLVRNIGIYGSIAIAAVINIVCFVITILYLKGGYHGRNRETPDELPLVTPKTNTKQARASFVATAYFIAGMMALGLETAWTRILVPILGYSIYAYTLVLIVFLVGVAAGGVIGARMTEQVRESEEEVFGWTLFWTGMVAVLPVLLIVLLFKNIEPLLKNSDYSMILKITITAVIVFPATTMMGIMFPVVVQVYTKKVSYTGEGMGNLLFFNTLGGVIGGPVFLYLLMPSLNALPGAVLFMAGYVILSIVFLRNNLTKVRVGAMILSAAVLGVTFMYAGTFSYRADRESSRARVLYYRDDPYAMVKVYENPDGIRYLALNNFSAGSDRDRSFLDMQYALGLFPGLRRPPAGRLLSIGFGAGGSTAVALRSGFTVDSIDLVPAVYDAAPLFERLNGDLMTSSHHRPIVADAAYFMKVTGDDYDAIIVTINSPHHAGNGVFYSREFYREARQRLDRSGIFVQWVPIHLVSFDEFRIMANTFLKVFPDAELWYTPFRNYLLLVGKPGGIPLAFEMIAKRIEDGRNEEDIRLSGWSRPEIVTSCYITDSAGLREIVAGEKKEQSVYHPLLEFFDPRYVPGSEFPIAEFLAFKKSPPEYLEDFSVLSRNKQKLILEYDEAGRQFTQALYLYWRSNHTDTSLRNELREQSLAILNGILTKFPDYLPALFYERLMGGT